VQNKEIGDSRQSIERIIVGSADRFPADVAAGHYQCRRTIRMGEKEVVQRRIGKHQADIAHVGSQIRGKR